MQAMMLAAGMGRRMGKYTEARTKCMIEVGGQTLIQRTVDALKEAGIRRFIIVVGWEGDKLVRYIQENITGIEFEFIYNHDYATTNNIYSLYMARDLLVEDDTILLESDLVYDKRLIRDIVEAPADNLVAVAKYEHWMDGTVVTLDEQGYITEFIDKRGFLFENVESYYKTVNVYKFSANFLKTQYLPFLEAYIRAYGKNQYYEMVLKALAHLSQAKLKAYVLGDIDWYEVDDAQDLDIANTLFAPRDEKLGLYARHFGGYWRFPHIKDFCYLVNPYFPSERMRAQMRYFYDTLLTQYPSGMGIQKLLSEKIFKIDEDFVLVGNGAAELINMLGLALSGKMTVSVPSFNEYIRCFRDCEITTIPASQSDYRLNVECLMQAAQTSDVLAIVNPDNPSGDFLLKDELIQILDACKAQGTTCIVDESFADFAEPELRYTLLDDQLLREYPNLIVVKSISKSYGVPGLRLGLMASSNTELMGRMRELLPVWNINSFAEYFLQIFSLYVSDYQKACDKLAYQRALLVAELQQIGYLKVYPSQANYVMCRLKEGLSAKDLATYLLDKHNLLIKDLSTKTGFDGKQYIRVAVKNEVENQMLISALKRYGEFIQAK